MRDLIYLNEMYSIIDEGKGIRSTILKKYYDNANGYASDKNPDTIHTELKSPSRRKVRYDYGNANYEEISAEEAIAYVNQNKENIQNLRIIYDINDKESFVEYEVRNNGNVYAIYGSSDPITINGRDYKNIRYATWKNVLLTADKIYKTDEYDHIINQEEQSERQRKQQIIRLQNPLPADSPDYDHYAHDHNQTSYINQYNSYNPKFAATEIDTGAHTPEDEIAVSSHVQDSFYNPYVYAKQQVNSLYSSLDRYRRALKKLEREKDDIEPDFYEAKKQKWTTKYNNIMINYQKAIKDFRKIKDKLELYMDKKSAELSKKLHNDIKHISELYVDIKNTIKQLEKTSKDTAVQDGDFYTKGYARNLNNSLTELATNVLKIQSALEKAQRELEPDDVVQGLQQDLETSISNYDNAIATFERIKNSDIQSQEDRFNKLLARLEELTKERDQLRPKAAAAKAAKAAKNKEAEIDPYLKDILDFGDSDIIEDESDDETIAV